jgi:hypothetical protein
MFNTLRALDFFASFFGRPAELARPKKMPRLPVGRRGGFLHSLRVGQKICG